MSQAETIHTTGAPGGEPGHRLLALARQNAARETALRNLAKLRKEASAEINRLIAFLDASDPYVMTELEDEDDREDIGDSEPSLGSFDRMMSQEKSYRQILGEFMPGLDAELDTSDHEPALGGLDHNHSQERWATGDHRDAELDDAESSGIADQDGLDEQVPFRDWQGVGMV
jgi:hypothetical protein